MEKGTERTAQIQGLLCVRKLAAFWGFYELLNGSSGRGFWNCDEWKGDSKEDSSLSGEGEDPAMCPDT